MAKKRKEDTPDRQANREYMLAYRKANIEKMKARERARYLANKEEENKRSRKNYSVEYHREYRDLNRDKINEQCRNLRHSKKEEDSLKRKQRRSTDINYLLKTRLRARVSCAIRDKSRKVGSAIRDLDCTVEQLKLHLESKFESGMTWDNYGRTGWHIDHVIPLKHFDLSNLEEFKQACHYTNLQPLWAKDNLRKGDKMP